MNEDGSPTGGRAGLQRMLLRVLYEAGFHRRSQRQPPSPPSPSLLENLPALRTATKEEIERGATCRFCFDGGGGEAEGKLIAPCACTGTQEFVHVLCLRKWQRASQLSGHHSGHESVCNVCKVPFALPPPALPHSIVRAGMLLVSTPRLAGTFNRAVVLLCEVDGGGAHGVIINRPVGPHEIEGARDTIEGAARRGGRGGSWSAAADASGAQHGLALDWRRGGPVCGGRLGVSTCLRARLSNPCAAHLQNRPCTIPPPSTAPPSSLLAFPLLAACASQLHLLAHGLPA